MFNGFKKKVLSVSVLAGVAPSLSSSAWGKSDVYDETTQNEDGVGEIYEQGSGNQSELDVNGFNRKFQKYCYGIIVASFVGIAVLWLFAIKVKADEDALNKGLKSLNDFDKNLSGLKSKLTGIEEEIRELKKEKESLKNQVDRKQAKELYEEDGSINDKFGIFFSDKDDCGTILCDMLLKRKDRNFGTDQDLIDDRLELANKKLSTIKQSVDELAEFVRKIPYIIVRYQIKSYEEDIKRIQDEINKDLNAFCEKYKDVDGISVIMNLEDAEAFRDNLLKELKEDGTYDARCGKYSDGERYHKNLSADTVKNFVRFLDNIGYAVLGKEELKNDSEKFKEKVKKLGSYTNKKTGECVFRPVGPFENLCKEARNITKRSDLEKFYNNQLKVWRKYYVNFLDTYNKEEESAKRDGRTDGVMSTAMKNFRAYCEGELKKEKKKVDCYNELCKLMGKCSVRDSVIKKKEEKISVLKKEIENIGISEEEANKLISSYGSLDEEIADTAELFYDIARRMLDECHSGFYGTAYKDHPNSCAAERPLQKIFGCIYYYKEKDYLNAVKLEKMLKEIINLGEKFLQAEKGFSNGCTGTKKMLDEIAMDLEATKKEIFKGKNIDGNLTENDLKELGLDLGKESYLGEKDYKLWESLGLIKEKEDKIEELKETKRQLESSISSAESRKRDLLDNNTKLSQLYQQKKIPNFS